MPSKPTARRRPHDYQYTPIRQRMIFAKEYIRTGNATAAWEKANPLSRAEYNSRRASACKMLAAPKTKELIAKLRERSFRNTAVSLEELVAENAAIVRFDPARIFDGETLRPWDEIEPEDRRCIAEIKIDERVDDHGNATRTTTVKRQDRGAALDRLAKMAGAYARDNAQKAQAAAIASSVDGLALAQRIAFVLQQGIREGKARPLTIEQPKR